MLQSTASNGRKLELSEGVLLAQNGLNYGCEYST